ncbi:MAG TPA: polyhydroxyalkanoate depolymerase, partial [Burkholderiaceae bacterium]
RPQDITTTALFTVEGELDDISGSGQTAAAHDLCTGIPAPLQKHLEAKGAGHYGIFSGRRWREIVYPDVKAFILAHNAQPLPEAKPVVRRATTRRVTKATPAKSKTSRRAAA